MFCICIDIYKIHVVSNSRHLLLVFNKVMFCFFLNIFRTNGCILIKLYSCIDIYKIHVVSNVHYVWSIFNRVMTLDRRQNFVYAQYLVNQFVNFAQILHMH